MAIRKDVNDALNNLKKEEKQAKKAPSKYDGMSVDDLIGVIDSKSAPKPPVKKLRKLTPVATKETSETAEKPVETEEKPPETAPKKKKKIVISGELPDYEALRQQEIEAEKKPPEMRSETAKKPPEKKSETKKKNQDTKEDKKNFFERFKDMMYIAEDDEDEEPEEKSENPTADFTIEEVKETEKVFQPPKEKAKSEEEKKSEKPRQESLPKKKKPESSEKTDSQAKKKSEGEKRSDTENKKKPPQSTQGNPVSPPKKKKKKPAENIGATDFKEKPKKKADSEKDELQKNIEMAIAEFEKSMEQNEQKKAEAPEKPVEVATGKPKSEKKPSTDVQHKKKQPTKPTNPPKSAEPAKRVQKDYTPDVNAPKTKLVGLVLVILSLIGLIAIINAVVSAVGGGKSANDDIKNAVYPAVIMDISTFENASQLSDDQIISATIWSVVMDKEKLSKYTQRANDMIVIPSADVSQYAIDLFGEEIPALTHTTVTTAEEKFYYNAETDCYNIQAQPDAHTYSPEVKDVSKHGKDYTVNVEYIEEHAEWIDKSVAKTARFELTKTSNGYRINSMELIG